MKLKAKWQRYYGQCLGLFIGEDEHQIATVSGPPPYDAYVYNEPVGEFQYITDAKRACESALRAMIPDTKERKR